MAQEFWPRITTGIIDGDTLSGFYSGGMLEPDPALVDIDDDGDFDLFVGDRLGKLSFYLNQGAPGQPNWSFQSDYYDSIQVSPTYFTAMASPVFVDIDNDGDEDLFIGNHYGTIYFYENTGTHIAPNFVFVTNQYNGIQVSTNSRPEFVDIDNDDDYDLFVTSSSTNEYFYNNLGTPQFPFFMLMTNNYFPMITSSNMWLDFVDIDADNDYDCFISDMGEDVKFLRNIGTPFNALWAIDSSFAQNLRFSYFDLADIDNDNDYDIICNSENASSLCYYENTGTLLLPNFTLNVGLFLDFQIADSVSAFKSNSFPSITDIDGDGDGDLFLGCLCGKITYISNLGEFGNPIWNYQTNYYAGISTPYSESKPTFADIDTDGDIDLFIGTSSGNIAHYRNDGTPTQAVWTFITNEYAGINVWANAVPAFVDIDNDCDLDLYIGNGLALIPTNGGRLYFYRNDGTAYVPNWTYISNYYAGIDVGDGSSPAFGDLDLDGDYDLLIGRRFDDTLINCYGDLHYYRNDGNLLFPSYTFVTETFNSIDVDHVSAPFIYDMNGDLFPDLLLGEYSGGINLYINPGTSNSRMVFIETIPSDTNIVLPPTGGQIEFCAKVYNLGVHPQSVDVWFELIKPDTTTISPILLRPNVTIAPGDTLIRNMIQNIPPRAPIGKYGYLTLVGDWENDSTYFQDGFWFTKQ
jgi:hypothetical protein